MTRRISALASALVLTLAVALAPTVALAQGTIFPEASSTSTEQPAASATTTTAQPAATATAAPAATDSTALTTELAAALPPAAPPVPSVEPHGQWVYTDSYGWIWVPEGSSAVIVQEQPYVYLYTPAYGWTWYGSPWGPGRYYVGPWVHAYYGPIRVWHRGGWYAPHPVVVRTHVIAPGYHGAPRGGGHRRR